MMLKFVLVVLCALFSTLAVADPKSDFLAAINACAEAFPETTDPARWACTQSAQAVFIAAVLSTPAQAPTPKK